MLKLASQAWKKFPGARDRDRTLGTRLAARSLILRDIGEKTFQPLDQIKWQSVGDCQWRTVCVVFEVLFSDLRSTMWIIFEIFVVLFKIFICYIEAVFRAIVRPSKKDIEGQTVLITGKRYASFSLELTSPIWRWVDLPQVDLMNFREMNFRVELVRPRSGRTE